MSSSSNEQSRYIEQELFIKLAFNLSRDTEQSIEVTGFWLWFEEELSKHRISIVNKLLELSQVRLNAVANEAVRCINILSSGKLPTNALDNNLPLTSELIGGGKIVTTAYFYSRLRDAKDRILKKKYNLICTFENLIKKARVFPVQDMTRVSIAEYREFHSIELELFIRLVKNLSLGIRQSNDVIGFWLWLEEMGFPIVSKLSILRDNELNYFAKEAVCCLGMLLAGVLPTHRDLQWKPDLMGSPFTLGYFYENGAAVSERVNRNILAFGLSFDDVIKKQSEVQAPSSRALMSALESVKLTTLSAPQILLSVDVISFWLWLEDSGHPHIFKALLIYRHDAVLVNLLVEEAENCLNWLRFSETPAHFDLRRTSALMRLHTPSPPAPGVRLFLANRYWINSAVSSNSSIMVRALATVSDWATRIRSNLLPPIPQHQLNPVASVVPLPTAGQGEVAEPVRADNSTRASPDAITTAVTEENNQRLVHDFTGLGPSIITDEIDDPVEIVQEAVSLITATEVQVQSEEEAPPDQENLNQGVHVADQNIDQDVPQQNGVLEGVHVADQNIDQDVPQQNEVLEGVHVADQNIDQDVPQQNGVLEGVHVADQNIDQDVPQQNGVLEVVHVADQNIDQDVPQPNEVLEEGPAAPVFVIPKDRTILMTFVYAMTNMFRTSITEDDVREYILGNYRNRLEQNNEHIERIRVDDFTADVVFNAPTAIPRVLNGRDKVKCTINSTRVTCTRYKRN